MKSIKQRKESNIKKVIDKTKKRVEYKRKSIKQRKIQNHHRLPRAFIMSRIRSILTLISQKSFIFYLSLVGNEKLFKDEIEFQAKEYSLLLLKNTYSNKTIYIFYETHNKQIRTCLQIF